MPLLPAVHIDLTALGFTLVIAIVTGIVFGLAPALHASNPDPGNMLKDAGRGTSHGGRNRMRSALIVSEVALSLMLLAGAGLLINSFWRLLHTDAGFDPKGVLAVDVPLSRTRYTKPEQRSAAFEQLIARMKTMPGVRDVSVVSNVPLTDRDVEISFQIEGRAPYKPGEEAAADYTAAGNDYFRVMNIALQRGRVFAESDTAKTPQVIIVSDAFVKRYFPNEDPIGRRIVFDGPSEIPREIIGIVADVRRNGLDVDVQPEMYVSHVQTPERRLNLVIRSEAQDASQLIQAARAEVKAFDPNPDNLAHSNSRTVVRNVSRSAPLQHAVAWNIRSRRSRARRGRTVRRDELLSQLADSGDRHSYGSRRHPRSREPHGGDERGLVGQRGIPSWRADGVLEYTIRRAQRRESSGWRGGAHCLGCGGPDRSGVHRGLRPHAPRHTRRAGQRTTRGIGCAEAFCWLRSVSTPQDGDVVFFRWYPGLGDDQR